MRQASDYSRYLEVVRDSFEHWYDAGRDSWTAAPAGDRVTEFICRSAPSAGPGRRRVLDIGCGRGHQAAQLAARLDADVTGIDVLDVWDALPPSRGTARFHHGDFLRYAGAPADMLVDNGCLHHQRRADWSQWVGHGRELLRAGGVWVIGCFLSPTPDVEVKPLDDGRLNWWLTPSAVSELFSTSGFTPAGQAEIDRNFNYQGHWLKYLVMSFTKGECRGRI